MGGLTFAFPADVNTPNRKTAFMPLCVASLRKPYDSTRTKGEHTSMVHHFQFGVLKQTVSLFTSVSHGC